MSSNNERKIVELQFNCTEGTKGQVVAMQADMVKAYGESYVKEVKDEKITEELQKAIEYAEENNISIPKNINVERFLKRIEATKEAIKNKAENEKLLSVNSEDVEKFEAEKVELQEQKDQLGQEQLALKEEKEAFEDIKKEFAQEKIDIEEIEKELTERGESVEKREVTVSEREKAVEAREAELQKITTVEETTSEDLKAEEKKEDNKKNK